TAGPGHRTLRAGRSRAGQGMRADRRPGAPMATDDGAIVHQARIGDGRVLLSRATWERYLARAGSAVLLEREGQVFLVPLGGSSAGGMLLKQRNAQGDRVLLAEEFLA